MYLAAQNKATFPWSTSSDFDMREKLNPVLIKPLSFEIFFLKDERLFTRGPGEEYLKALVIPGRPIVWTGTL